ncbi:MAG TPA: hypothetical protein PLP61_07140 [Nocardioides sp.]|uniref:hypothetical protein n=1 Tax=Nocardioides sp. TaxID=35761 RepID=UPI002B7B692D|nr:hypothetical protein [Nocardioides sp.]HQR26797.1 hypothetical protein [Nocardioides sp.]
MPENSEKSLITQAAELAETVRPTIESAMTAAKEVALPLLNDAREKAAPILADGKALASEKAAATKAALAATALTQAAPVETGPSSGRRWLKRLLLVGALAAVGAVVFKRLRGDSGADNWQSSYVPTPAPAPRPAPEAPATDDASGASPDEAVSDALEEPHPVTTPDAPAEVVELLEPEAHKPGRKAAETEEKPEA